MEANNCPHPSSFPSFMISSALLCTSEHRWCTCLIWTYRDTSSLSFQSLLTSCGSRFPLPLHSFYPIPSSCK